MMDKATLGAILVIVAGAVGWCADRDGRLRAEGRAEIAEALVEERGDSLEVARQERELARARAQEAQARADSIAAAAAAEVERLRRARPVLVDSIIVEAGADSTVVREAVERVSASYEAELEEERRASSVLRAALYALEDDVVALEAENHALRALNAALEDAARARAPTRQGWIARNAERALLLVGGAAVGALGAELAR